MFYREGRVCSVDTVQITDGLITAYRRVIHPDKLVRVRTVTPEGLPRLPDENARRADEEVREQVRSIVRSGIHPPACVFHDDELCA
ncbi:hypothetical protein Shyhy02_42670 [Streptomyces hygroscopicus subsp. hygroscopicus]|nr:hypothetical protein Shyhy02_42670 [Streptomyces hygroscopicus subsp. hygroscopicus]